jgi:hypothetical protein
MSDAKPKLKKPSFIARMKNRGREAKALGQVLVNEPKAFPSALLRLLRRSLRTIWDARGGGLYACGFVVTFVFLEIRMFVLDIFTADSVSGFFSDQVSEMLFKYLGESIQNTVQAFIWPVHVIDIQPPWGIGALIVMYFVFPVLIKDSLEKWLFDESADG